MRKKLSYAMEYSASLSGLVGSNCNQGSCSHTGSNSSACYGVKLSKKTKK